MEEEYEVPVKIEHFDQTREDGTIENMVRETFENGETIEHSIHAEVKRLKGGMMPPEDLIPQPITPQISDTDVMMAAMAELYEEVLSLKYAVANLTPQ